MTPRAVLRRALDASGRVLRARFGKVTARYKGRANLLTAADLASQRRVLRLIKRNFPRHDYVAEEKETRLTGSEYVWIIDPLDGTTNYAHGYPVACVSIGLLRGGKPFLGGIYDPFRDECFLAEAGRGATMNGRPLRVSKTPRLSSSLLITGFAYDRGELSRYYLEFFRSFMVKCHDIRRSGSAALDLAWIAAGRADGFWEFNLSPWDVAAGWLLVQEAGGTVSDFSGNPPAYPGPLGRQTLASNGLIHRAMLKDITNNIRSLPAISSQ